MGNLPDLPDLPNFQVMSRLFQDIGGEVMKMVNSPEYNAEVTALLRQSITATQELRAETQQWRAETQQSFREITRHLHDVSTRQDAR